MRESALEYVMVWYDTTVWYDKDGPSNVAAHTSAEEYDIVLHSMVWLTKTHPQKSYMVQF